MKLNIVIAGTAATLLLGSQLAFGHLSVDGAVEAGDSGYLSAGSLVIKTGTGECLRTGDLNDDNMINACEGIEDKVEAPKAEASPAETEVAAPEPTIVPVSRTMQADFATGSAIPTADGEAEISALIAELSQFQGIDSIAIGGHADSRGSEASNQKLSEDRANTVRERLAAAFPGATITATGYGESDPIASNDTAEGRAQNRRVEVVVNARTTQ